MNKIIRLLRLSRLVLLVILLLFAVAAKIARAETAQLWWTLQCTADVSYSQNVFGSPQAVLNQCFPRSRLGRQLDNGVYVVVSEHGQEHASIWPSLHTCEAKELTHNGVSDGVETPPWFHWISAPKGYEAKTWFPERYESCENNCVVRNTRYVLSDGTWYADEADGTSRGSFNRRQTGEVCVPEKPKKNDPPKPPAPDTDNGTGNGQSNPGSGDGQSSGQGDGGGSGQGSSGSDGQNNPESGNSNPDSPDGSGSSGGSGGGGSSGGGGQLHPGGNSNGGSQSGGDQGSGSESGTGGESDGDGDQGGGSGDGGRSDSDGSSGEGQVDGGDPDGQGEGNGEGNGEGSISGGSCEANQVPDCKGDPIQCYIAREQWRTACAASGQSNTVESEGNCESNTPPKCKGDAVQCYMAKQQWQQGCAAAAAQGAIGELSEYGKGQQGYLDDLAREGNPDGILDGVKTDTIDLVGKLNTGLVKLPNACPTFPPIDLGIYGKYEIETDDLCSVLRTLGRILLAMSYIWGFGIIVRAM